MKLTPCFTVLTQVTAGDGHSWKGSVVSDTVKRGCPSVPMVSVQRQDVYSQPSNGKIIMFCVLYSLQNRGCTEFDALLFNSQ